MNLYGPRSLSTGSRITPWSHVLQLSGVGQGLGALASFYTPRTETNITGTLEIASTLDGPIQVARFGDVTLNGATITVDNPCRGLFVICDSLTTTGTASTIHMNGKGAINYIWEDYDLTIPQSVALSSSSVSLQYVLNMLRAENYFVGDPQLWRDLAHLVTGGIVHGTNKIVDKSGFGSGGVLAVGAGTCGGTYFKLGGSGGAGTTGPGGGSAGLTSVADNYTVLYCMKGGNGHSWRGGLPGNASHIVTNLRAGEECRAVNPAGVLVVAVLNSINLGVGLTLSANSAYTASDTNSLRLGSSGGGAVKLLTPSTVSSNITLQANGATSNVGGGCDISGGAGIASQSTFTAWGL